MNTDKLQTLNLLLTDKVTIKNTNKLIYKIVADAYVASIITEEVAIEYLPHSGRLEYATLEDSIRDFAILDLKSEDDSIDSLIKSFEDNKVKTVIEPISIEEFKSNETTEKPKSFWKRLFSWR